MKKMIGLSALMLMLVTVGVASAVPTGFEVHKWTSVTGDWAWDGSAWQQGNFETGTYQFEAMSPGATIGTYTETENLGTPWMYELSAETTVNGEGHTHTEFSAWTVNDPDTTPATGGYTHAEFMNDNFGEYGESHLSVLGEGSIFVGSDVTYNSGFTQFNYANINN